MRPSSTPALIAAAWLLAAAGPLHMAHPATQPVSATTQAPGEHIVAVVNGDVISEADVQARGRLLALSTGLPVTPDVLQRLRPQFADRSGGG